MARPLFEGPELRHASRILGALLMIVAGAIMLFQTYLVNIVPPADGFKETTATVISSERTGTFREPAFLVSLSYQATDTSGESLYMRSGQRVEFEIYHTLNAGDTVEIYYNPEDPFEWRLMRSEDELRYYAPGLIMVLLGMFSLAFPLLINWGSRQQDFELTDEWGNNPPIGVEH